MPHILPSSKLITYNLQISHLNQRNQVGGQVSVALPIHFAQKLAKRVFSYFYFYATNSASLEPNLQLYTYFGDIDEAYLMDEQMTAYIKSFFHEQAKVEENTLPPEKFRDVLRNSNLWDAKLNDKMFYL